MTDIDKNLIAMRIAYHTDNQTALGDALRMLVRRGCSINELYANCSTLEMRRAVRAELRALGLKPVKVGL